MDYIFSPHFVTGVFLLTTYVWLGSLFVESSLILIKSWKPERKISILSRRELAEMVLISFFLVIISYLTHSQYVIWKNSLGG